MLSVKGAVATADLGSRWTDQSQSLTETLSAYTRDGAYAEFSEARKGRLKAGMLADIVVMSSDLEQMEPHALDKAAPVMTLCGGQVTFEA